MERTAVSRTRSRRKTTRGSSLPKGPSLLRSVAAPAPAARSDRPDREIADALLRHLDVGVLIVDPDGILADLNPAAARMLELVPARVRGTKASSVLRTVVPGDDPVRDAFRSPGGESEAVLLSSTGGELPAVLHTQRVGRPAWIVVVIRDLTSMRRMQQELRRHERLATLGQLAAGVAHEIRNPLAGIGTSAQVLLRRFEPRDDRARFVKVILEEVERLDRIVRSLLQYGRPPSPRLRPEAIAPCLSRVLELSEERIAKAGVRVELEVAKRLSPVYIDPELVTQVLLNVTINAIEAMPPGGRLRYELRQVRRRGPQRGPGRRASDSGDLSEAVPARSDRGWLTYQQVRVIDEGPGIPRGVLEKLFDPFFSTKPRGTGLGLSISQTIMQEHGGSIAVASREGRGTTVLLNFPVEKRHGQRRQHDGDPERADALDR